LKRADRFDGARFVAADRDEDGARAGVLAGDFFPSVLLSVEPPDGVFDGVFEGVFDGVFDGVVEGVFEGVFLLPPLLLLLPPLVLPPLVVVLPPPAPPVVGNAGHGNGFMVQASAE